MERDDRGPVDEGGGPGRDAHVEGDDEWRGRSEDAALLTGAAEFTDDLSAPDAAHLAFARSERGHADLIDVDVDDAAAHDGVLGAFTWDDVAASDAPGELPVWGVDDGRDVPGHPLLARDRVRYHGQPVAAVVAETPAVAHDAARAVEVTYDDRDAVTDPVEAAGAEGPTLFAGAPDNLATVAELGDEEATAQALSDADHTVSLDLANNRLIPHPLEPRAALVRYGREGSLTVQLSTQTPHMDRRNLSDVVGIPERDVRVDAPAVGGGFGQKGNQYPGEATAAWCALELERSVKWTATRREDSLAGAHGRAHATDATIAVDDDGTARGLSVETDVNVGGYALGDAPAVLSMYGLLLSGQYRVPAIHCRTRCVFTNTAPVHTYRGAGIPEAIYVIERLLDAAARELGVDPAELRRQNLIPPAAFPYETAAGATYDSGDYEATLDRALDVVDYEGLRERQQARRPEGRYLGIGLGSFVASTGRGTESGRVNVNLSGEITAYAGTMSQGQGHETTYANLVAEAFDVSPAEVSVEEGDTADVEMGWGTFGSRSTVTAGNAVAEAAADVVEKVTRITADYFEVDPARVTVEDGHFRVEGDPDASLSLADVAELAHGWALPDDLDPGLDSTVYHGGDGETYSFGTHVAVVEVDPETGEVDVRRYLGVNDCGNQIDPTIVEGQVHGGVAQGIGQALYEQTVYEDGRLVTDTLQEYAVPRAGHLPDVETEFTVTPSETNPLGVRGIGEAGTIAAPPAVVNAVLDALAPLGVEDLDMPLTQETVWRSIHDRE
ncbi:carbon monoxide dehydrogenase [Halobacteriales archaeon QS_1_68_20]|nr:MAG: carbon monoxide dehydrogenase [Halobacteriales archaeon QS_1_68_20]